MRSVVTQLYKQVGKIYGHRNGQITIPCNIVYNPVSSCIIASASLYCISEGDFDFTCKVRLSG